MKDDYLIISLRPVKCVFRTKLVITCILSMCGCSSGYSDEGGKITFNGKEITGKNFIVLNNTFAKDDSAAYYKDYSIAGADIKTFTGLDKLLLSL